MKHPAIFFLSVSAFLGAVARAEPVSAASQSLTAADKAYVIAVRNKLRDKVAYDVSSHGSENPKVVFRVLLLPTGEVMSVDRMLGSGIEDFDTAVRNGIWKASPLPKRSDGRVEDVLVIEYWLQGQPPQAAVTH